MISSGSFVHRWNCFVSWCFCAFESNFRFIRCRFYFSFGGERERERELGGRDVGWKVIMVLIEGKYGDNCDGGLWISGLNREAFDPSGRPSGFWIMSIYWIVSEILSFVSSFCEFDETLLNNPIFHIRNSGNSKLCTTCIYIYIHTTFILYIFIYALI